MARPAEAEGGSSPVEERSRWFRVVELARLYDPLRAQWGGPPLHVFRTLPDGDRVPAGAEPALSAIFERALRRIRSGEWDSSPAVAVRIEREEAVDGGDEVVVRVFDTGPVVDPLGVPDPAAFCTSGASYRREPPAGSWNGIAVLRIPDRPARPGRGWPVAPPCGTAIH